MAERIANLIIGGHATANGWRVPEHFSNKWVVDRTYAGSLMLRPYGTTPGALARVVWSPTPVMGTRRSQAGLAAQSSKALFAKAVLEGRVTASAFLNAIEGDPIYEQWYRRIWNFIATRFIDRNKGGGEHRSTHCARMRGRFSEKLTSITLRKLVSFQLCQQLAA
jgi:sulfoquinovose isomerase